MHEQKQLFILPSGLDTLAERIQTLYREIQDLYLRYQRPWVIGFSGGKDSTAVVQLVWRALERLSPDQRRYPVFIVGGDTLVEDPAMAVRLQSSIGRINEASVKNAMNISAHIVKPALASRFFVLLVGKGYPAPSSHFRWCTDRLKIQPATTFIEERVSMFREVIVVLGAREQESTTRAQTMQTYEIPNEILRRHSTLSSAWVYAPIAKWSTQDVWNFLLANASPWGDINRNLAALYKQGEGECPLVVDTSTPTCGGGRFGCWTCSVASHNRSLEVRFEEGEEWLWPLIEFRELLRVTIDPEHKLEYRDVRQRRTNRINLTRRGEVSPRSYSLDTRKMLLRRLLEAQVQVQKEGPDLELELISFEELAEIRRIWITEDGDWEDSLCSIYRDVVGHSACWDLSLLPFRRQSGTVKHLLDESSREEALPLNLLLQCLEAIYISEDPDNYASIFPLLDRILSKDWRDPAEVVAELKAQWESAQTKQEVNDDGKQQLPLW